MSIDESKSTIVAAIIPVYNRNELLIRALRIVLKQSRKVDQIIVVDDHSSSPSRDFISAVEEFNGTPIHILRLNKNCGVSTARNAGIAYAISKGADFIALLDSDDEWMPKKLEKQLQELAKTNLLVCHSNETWIRDGQHLNQHKKHKKRGGKIFEDSMRMCSMSPSTVLIHKSVLLDVGSFDEQFVVCEDFELWLRVTKKYQVAFLEESLVVKHGGHTDQLSTRFKGMDYFRILALKKLKQSQASDLSEDELLKLDEWIALRTQWLGEHFNDMAQGKMTLRIP